MIYNGEWNTVSGVKGEDARDSVRYMEVENKGDRPHRVGIERKGKEEYINIEYKYKYYIQYTHCGLSMKRF